MAKQISVRLDDTIYDSYVVQAEHCGMSLTEYIRELLIHGAQATQQPSPETLPDQPTPRSTLPQADAGYLAPGAAIRHTSYEDNGQLHMARCGRHMANGSGECATCRR